jgi:hypothetical protein
MTAATRALVLRTLTTADLVVSVAGLVAAGVWAEAAWTAEGSTAGIGVVLALLLATPLLLALGLTGLALALRRREVAAMTLAGAAATVLVVVAFGLVSLFIPF